MKLLMIFIFTFGSGLALGDEKSQLVDVDKNSKLSDYFKKMNKKVSDDSESKELVKVSKKAKSSKESLSEENILLAAATKTKKKSSTMSPLNKVMISIFALMGIAAVVFSAIHKAGKKKGHTSIAKNIKVLTQKSIGPKKNLMLIRVAGETILLGVTDNNINHIKTLSLMEDELPEYTEPKFSSQLKDKIEKTNVGETTEEVDGFSISRLDDVKKAVTQRFSV